VAFSNAAPSAVIDVEWFMLCTLLCVHQAKTLAHEIMQASEIAWQHLQPKGNYQSRKPG